jgi:hypothetical protein
MQHRIENVYELRVGKVKALKEPTVVDLNLFQNLLPDGTEEIVEKLQSGYTISWAGIEPWISLFRSVCANHSIATFRAKLHTI